MQQIVEKNQCTGCAGCANICPSGAIGITQDENGFHRPIINQEKCTNCGLCKTVCPIVNYKEEYNREPDVYAVWAPDEIREKSSSGGLFTLLAEYVLEKGGYVSGAGFNADWEVEHILINKIEELDKLRGSKYVQSRISENLFKEIKNKLEEGHWVLFTGCPCQSAGLKYFLKKDYPKLILVDLLCSCAPSPKVFKKYLEYIIPQNDRPVKINFRDKNLKGWSCTHTTTTTTTTITDNKFMHSFLSKTISHECCGICKFATLPRQSDITIADFWGIEKYKKNWNDKKGTSIFMINNNKGQFIYDEIKNKFKRTEKVPLKYAMQKVLYEPFKLNKLRDKYFKIIDKNDFITTYEKTLGKQNNIGIMNFWYVPNRGAILTNYAINEFLKEQGYNPKTINYYPRIEKRLHKNSISEQFEKKYLDTTAFCEDYIALKKLNKEIGTFLVGSDQVFRDWCIRHHRDKYFLNFADDNAKKIACSASFGIPFYDGSESNKTIMQKYLSRFDALSVRETSGVNILKNTFNLESTQIWDPVFYIDKSKYEQIAQTSKKNESKFLAYYIITMTPEKRKAIEFAAAKLGLKTVDMKGKLPVEDWLYYIKNCEYYIGDSFHGTCFALMFNKNFLVISPRTGENDTRLDTLLETVNMQNRQLQSAKEVYSREDLLTEIDYSGKFDKLNSEIERSKKWLIDAIEAPKQDKPVTNEDKLFFAAMDRLNIESSENQRRQVLINNRGKIYLNYLKCGILRKLIFNKKRREHYKKKYKNLSIKMRELKSLDI